MDMISRNSGAPRLTEVSFAMSNNPLKLIDALAVLNAPRPTGTRPRSIGLACGFTPSHLNAFLHAHLLVLDPSRDTQVEEGLFGDLCGNMERFARKLLDACVVTVEWPDLDPRLSVRSQGGCDVSDLPDIARVARLSARRIRDLLVELAATTRVVVSLPSLRMPLVSFASPLCLSPIEINLNEAVSILADCVRQCPSIAVLNPQWLAFHSSLSERSDVSSELAQGFPYARQYASLLSQALARLVLAPSPKKGLITDLDETLWKGILGEAGVEGVSWDLTSHSQIHAAYQLLLQALASAGTLVAVASKNDSALVEEAFRRKDILLHPKHVYPREVNWGSKSSSVAAILKTWNISADSVVFVDDSPMEIAEVQRAFPEITALHFPSTNPVATCALFEKLREYFGKPFLSNEDAIRSASIRANSDFQNRSAPGESSPEGFLRELDAQLWVEQNEDGPALRAFELVNKTNQFNLNGERLSWADWKAFRTEPGSFRYSFSYQDKFGPLGEIAVVLGKVQEGTMRITTWVMSCRAFSRRIEFATLRELFENFAVDEIALEFKATPRNGPFQEFLSVLSLDRVDGLLKVSRRQFEARCPALYSEIREKADAPHA